jgi:hypothetical protein
MLLSPAKAPPASTSAARRRAAAAAAAPPTAATTTTTTRGRRGLATPTPTTMTPRRAPKTAAAASSAENFEGAMLEPSVANKLPVRAAALAASVAGAAYFGAPSLAPATAAFFHLMAVAIFLGSAFYTTFIAGILMFKNLPRQTFGKLQSKLFPVYFWLLTAACGVAFGTLSAATPGGAAAAAASFGGRAILVAAFFSLLNALVLEPKATENMFERYALEDKIAKAGAGANAADQEKKKALGKKFGALHGGSSMANLVALCAVVAHAYQLAGRLALV